MAVGVATKEASRGVYDVRYVSKRLGISINHTHKLAKAGVFPVLILGRRYIAPSEAFDDWLRSAGKS